MITMNNGAQGESGKMRVTFSMPAVACENCLYLVGWFGEWDESVYRMERTPDGDWSLTLELEPGAEYHYRFRTEDGRWLEDPSLHVASRRFGLNASFVVNRDMRHPSSPQTSPGRTRLQSEPGLRGPSHP